MSNKNTSSNNGEFIPPAPHSQPRVEAPASCSVVNYQLTPTSMPITAAEAAELRSEVAQKALDLGIAYIHPHGGCVIYNGAWIKPTAFAGFGALVLPGAWVGARATIQDNAIVAGHVIGTAIISGNAYVSPDSSVGGSAQVTDNVHVRDGAVVRDRVRVGGKITLGAGVRVGGSFCLVGDFTVKNASFDIGRNLVITTAKQIRSINAAFEASA